MSMPPNKYLTGTSHWNLSIDGYGNPSTVEVHNQAMWRVRSSAANFTRSDFVYRGPTRLIGGVLYIDGELVRGDRAPKVRYKKGVWRNPTPYTCSLDEGDLTHFEGYQGYKYATGKAGSAQYGYLVNSDYNLSYPAVPSYDGTLETRAIVKALGKLKAQKVNLAQAFAERDQTVRMVSSTLAGLAKAATSLRKGNFRGVAEGLGLRGLKKQLVGRNFHDRWLELQYGWKPLLSDVYGAVSALHEKDTEDPKRYCVTVTGKASTKERMFSASHLSYCYEAISEQEIKKGCFVRLDYYLGNPLLRPLSSLGITNPVDIAWELIPWSFVVDWFIPIGQYLNAMDAAVGYDFRAGSCSQIVRMKHRAFILGEDNSVSLGYHPTTCYGAVNTRHLRLQRTVYNSSPLPRIPSFKNPFPRNNQAHFQNALALLASSGSGRRQART